MKTTKATHIKEVRERYASNQRHILVELGWDQDHYNNLWLDLGRVFVEGMQIDAMRVERILSDRKYWQWWLLEWKRREDYGVRTFSHHDVKMTEESYLPLMVCMVDNYKINASFMENYFKQ